MGLFVRVPPLELGRQISTVLTTMDYTFLDYPHFPVGNMVSHNNSLEEISTSNADCNAHSYNFYLLRIFY